MSRIKSCNVNFGESLLIGEINEIELKKHQEAAKIEGMALPILKKAQVEAQDIIARAKEEAQKIIQEAQNQKNSAAAEIEKSAQEAMQKAIEEGFEKGKIDALSQMQDKLSAVDSFAGSEFGIKAKILDSAKKDMVALCLKICEKICTLNLDEKILEEIIAKAISILETKSQINVMISPCLASKLPDNFDEKFTNIKVIQNKRIADDAIIVESLGGNVDCTISSQIEKIAGELLNVE